MKYGVVLPIWQLTVADAESLATKTEGLGLDGVFVPDHILAKPATTQHYGGHWPDPFSLLAFLAGRTRRIHLGASVIVLPYRNPLVAAKAAATVDQASGGRFIFGVGVGWDQAEFVDLRLPFAERGRLSDDYLRAIKAAFSADMPQYDGKYVSFSGATFSPRPAQRPHPPIWVGGSPAAISGPAVRRCAELGDAWHPLALGLDDIEKGYTTLRELASRTGRRPSATCPKPIAYTPDRNRNRIEPRPSRRPRPSGASGTCAGSMRPLPAACSVITWVSQSSRPSPKTVISATPMIT